MQQFIQTHPKSDNMSLGEERKKIFVFNNFLREAKTKKLEKQLQKLGGMKNHNGKPKSGKIGYRRLYKYIPFRIEPRAFFYFQSKNFNKKVFKSKIK